MPGMDGLSFIEGSSEPTLDALPIVVMTDRIPPRATAWPRADGWLQAHIEELDSRPSGGDPP